MKSGAGVTTLDGIPYPGRGYGSEVKCLSEHISMKDI
jgi:hypothetical protein